jgi:hypothetical protein
MSSCNILSGAQLPGQRTIPQSSAKTSPPPSRQIKKRAEECPILADSSIPDTTTNALSSALARVCLCDEKPGQSVACTCSMLGIQRGLHCLQSASDSRKGKWGAMGCALGEIFLVLFRKICRQAYLLKRVFGIHVHRHSSGLCTPAISRLLQFQIQSRWQRWRPKSRRVSLETLNRKCDCRLENRSPERRALLLPSW